MCVCMNVCVYACVCVCVCINVYVNVCVCVCVRKKFCAEGERERAIEVRKWCGYLLLS
jgi:hypothetical protein